MVGEEKRHQMMQNLFGDQSEEEEEEVESEHESNRQPDYASDEETGGLENEGQDEVEGLGEAEIDSEGEHQDHDESEGERDRSSQEVMIGNQRGDDGEKRYSENNERQEYDHWNVSNRRQAAIGSGSERSGENHYVGDDDDDDEEVSQGRRMRSPAHYNWQRSVDVPKDEQQLLQSASEIRDVFGDSDAEDRESPIRKEEHYGKELRPDDMVADEDAPYDSEEEHHETKPKEKLFGPPLELEIPLCHPPAQSNKMSMIKVSNIMGVDPKPFDPSKYEEEDFYVTDESGAKKKIRLENNIVRFREVRKRDGTIHLESNARFVEWSDGSLQLLIGTEVLDISKQDIRNERSHLFLRHRKGILQSQGQISSKMRFMPSSLTSKSHRLLTALVDSRHKKVYKVKNCITDIDPEKEKEQQEKAVSQSIRANELLTRKKEKVSRKYTQPIRRERQLSPGFLEDALDEEDDQDYYEPRRSHRRSEDDLEQEARAEKRIVNAKKGSKNISRKLPAPKASRRPVDFSETEESEYETEGEKEDEGRLDDEGEEDYAAEEEEEEMDQRDEEEEEEEEEADYDESEEEEPKQQQQKGRNSTSSSKRKAIDSDDESSLPQKTTTSRRRMKIIYDSDDE